MKILWTDTETTGLDEREHGLIQVAGIVDINGKMVDEFNYQVCPFPNDKIDQAALDKNGVTVEQMATFYSPYKVHKFLVGIFGQYVNKYDTTDKMYLGGQNPSFDVRFLKEFWEKNNDPYFGSWFDYHLIDTASLGVVLKILKIIDPINPETGKFSVSQRWLAPALGIIQEARHDALDDIRTTRKMFYKMIDMLGGIPND